MGPGPYVLPAVVFAFAATESFISTLYKAIERLDAAGLRLAAPLPAASKFVEKFEAVEKVVTGAPAPLMPLLRLREFGSFRNAVLHDLSTSTARREYHHTGFSGEVQRANVLDVVESLRCARDAFDYFRYVFADADLMPEVLIEDGWLRFDTFVDEVAETAFAACLQRKGLTTSRPRSDADPCRCPAELRTLISHAGPTYPSNESGDPIEEALSEVSLRRPPDTDSFLLPNYTRLTM